MNGRKGCENREKYEERKEQSEETGKSKRRRRGGARKRWKERIEIKVK